MKKNWLSNIRHITMFVALCLLGVMGNGGMARADWLNIELRTSNATDLLTQFSFQVGAVQPTDACAIAGTCALQSLDLGSATSTLFGPPPAGCNPATSCYSPAPASITNPVTGTNGGTIGTFGYYNNGGTQGYFLTSLDFGFKVTVAGVDHYYWVRGNTAVPNNNVFDIFATDSSYTVPPLNAQEIIKTKQTCRGWTDVGTNTGACFVTQGIVPEIDAGVLPKAALLLGALFLLRRARVRAA